MGIASPGLLEVVDTDRGHVVESIETEPGDVERQRLYVFLPESCVAAVYEED